MFAQAIQRATPYTRSVVVSRRYATGRLECGNASFVVVNRDGWMVTSNHVFAAVNPDEVTNVSYWWGQDGLALREVYFDPLADLAVGRLDGFDPATVAAYPVFAGPGRHLLTGTFLCRLGYPPLQEITAVFDPERNAFTLERETLPTVIYPLEGMHTRIKRLVNQDDRAVEFIETSSPGLRGQSGGPVFDVQGVVWGLQSHTAHLPLGFAPKIQVGGREVEEHQVLNVGYATHVREVVRLLAAHGVAFAADDGEAGSRG